MSRYSNIETSLAMSTLATWSHVVQSRYVSPHNFDGLAMSGLAFSVAPSCVVFAVGTITRGWNVDKQKCRRAVYAAVREVGLAVDRACSV